MKKVDQKGQSRLKIKETSGFFQVTRLFQQENLSSFDPNVSPPRLPT